MKKLFRLVLVLVMVASLAACSSETVTDTETDDSLVIGFVGPLEGNTSVYGIAVSNGGELALDDYNEANGTNFVLVKEDSKGDSTEAVNAYNKLVDNDGIVGLLGGVLSGESTAIGSSSQQVGTPIISASATAAGFTLTGSNVFRGCFIDPLQATALANFSLDTLSAKTAAIIYDSGSDYSTGLAEVFTEVFEAAGGTIVEYEAYNTGDVDFNTQLTKISQANADVIFSPNYYNDDYLIMKQAKDLGITATFLGGDGWDGILTIEGMDTTVAEGAVFVNHYAPDDNNVAEWLARYKEVFGADPNAFSVLGYDSMNILLEAIDAAEDPTDSEAVVANMQATDYNGVLGHLVFDENGDPIKDLAYITIQDGKYVSYGK
jgi:branched-chain amino acid transport system substrate-binding protein